MLRFTGKASAKLLRFCIMLGLVFFGFGHLGTAAAETPATGMPTALYVSPDGNDGNPGTIAAPFATIQRARDAVRSLNPSMTGDIAVYLRGGVYRQNNPVRFTEADSGMNGYEVVYRNYPGEEPIISGGMPVSGWESYNGHIYKAHIGTGRTFSTLYEQGDRLISARYPNEDYLSVASQDAAAPKSKFGFAPGELPAVANPADLQVYLWSGGSLNYDNQTVEVKTIDYAQNTVALKSSTTYNMAAGSRYYVQGALELLDAPGEYYLDRAAGDLYYWPRDNGAPEGVEIPYTKRIFEFIGSSEASRVSTIRLEGLNIQETDAEYSLKASTQDGAIYMENADHITIRGSQIHGTGLNGIFLNGYAQNNIIYGNLIYDTGFTGVRFIGPKASRYINRSNQVTNNHIHDVGQLVGTGSGITLTLSGDNLISHNRIHNSPRFCISFSTGWYDTYLGQTIDGIPVTEDNLFDFLHTRNNVIEYNDLFDGMKDTADGGVIYSAGTGSGNVVRNNRVHDTGFSKFFGMSVYMDRDSDQVLVTHNLIDHVAASGGLLKDAIWQAGKNDIVTNNVVADSRATTGGGVVGTYYDNEALTVKNNIFYQFDTAGGSSNVYTFNKWGDSLIQAADNNLIYNSSGSYKVKGWPIDRSFSSWQTAYDQHSLTVNPQFVDADNGDYRLRYDSPAYSLGFTDIDYASIGLLPDFPFSDPDDSLAALSISADGSSAASVNLEANSSLGLETSARSVNGYVLDLTSATLSYASDNPAVAAVDASGAVLAFQAGVARIAVTATLAGVTRSSAIDIIVGDRLGTMELTAAQTALLPEQSLELQTKVRSQFGQYYDSASLDIQYASSDDSVVTVAVDGTVTAQALGTATITATVSKDGVTLQDTLTLRVMDNVLSGMTLAFASQSGASGFIPVGQSAALQLAGTMSDGSTADLSAATITYESSDPAIAAVGPDGVVHGLAGGKATAAARIELDGILLSRMLPVIVLADDDVPPPWSVSRYGTGNGYAAEHDGQFDLLGSGNVWGTADDFVFVSREVTRSRTWSVVSISATLDSMEDINTNAAVGIMLRDSPGANSKNVMLRVTPGGGLQMTYRTIDGGTTSYVSGKVLSFPTEIKLAREGDVFVSYYKENGSWVKYKEVSTVVMDDSMLAGFGVYSAVDTAAAASVSQVTVTEETPQLARLEIATDYPSIAAGDSAHLSLTGYAGGQPIDLSAADISFASSDPAVATVEPDGTVTGIADGLAVITATATLDGITVSASLQIVIASPQLARIDLSGTTTGMALGGSYQLSVRALLDNGAVAALESVTSVTYASSNPAVAEIAADGTITPLAVGVTKLTAEVTRNGVAKSASVIAVVANGTYFSDGFENGLGQWTTVSGTPSAPVTERPRSGSYSFKLDNDVETISHTLPESVNGVVEAWFYDSGAPGLSGGLSIQNDYFAGLKNDSSATHYLERYGNYFNLAGPRQEGWHQIIFDLYTNPGKVNIYIDGILAMQRTRAGVSILKIQDIWSGKVSNLYFDDVAVYKMAP
ncbi:Ig-like domain-containing protein [Paenibacillus sp. YN15]|uniref:Ig-like domain-containing protein n=1 Tax=Paenibacillus sp. YN15 TaxID=1742774 RepID=UPI000DCC733A|nr:Ig-like domain-containing protein [Paenibacillus sp. YN15]RAV00215.1 hypothetical protein DQG13_14780 [Paenibacillus sp. YN15]